MNNRGQALIETLGVLKVTLGLLFMFFAIIHSLFINYLVDHWNYQAALCLAQQFPQQECATALETNLNRLPLLEWRHEHFHRDSNHVMSRLKINTFALTSLTKQEDLNLPIRKESLRGLF